MKSLPIDAEVPQKQHENENSELLSENINDRGSDMRTPLMEYSGKKEPNILEEEIKKPEYTAGDIKYMREALKQARLALKHGEVPIGCVIVYRDKIIGRGYNRRNTDKCTLSHAEITAVKRASKSMGDWRLEECTMYVTLEPCQMCAGAIVQARIPRVFAGASSPKAGCAGSVLNILENNDFNHQVDYSAGLLEEECQAILKRFFTQLRIRNKQEREEARNNQSCC